MANAARGPKAKQYIYGFAYDFDIELSERPSTVDHISLAWVSLPFGTWLIGKR